MTAVLWSLALWLTSPLLILAWIKADGWLDGRFATEHTESLPDADEEWLAVLAATESTPEYDRLCCEFMERAEGWVA